MEIQELYNMEPLENKTLREGYEVQRVPGGWIFHSQTVVTGIGNGVALASVFVPFDNEFAAKVETPKVDF